MIGLARIQLSINESYVVRNDKARTIAMRPMRLADWQRSRFSPVHKQGILEIIFHLYIYCSVRENMAIFIGFIY